jgi:succinyl-CoA synthetase alpha subunit/malate-CoA ligase subunit alpha
MSIFVGAESKVIIQGFTGQHATFHAQEAIRGGTPVVGGVTPGKGGMTHLELPVFHTVEQAVEATGADVSGIFVPPAFAADAIMEAIDAGIRVIVVIADGVPVQDMMRVKRYAIGHEAVIIGPNTAGIITPGACKVGIMPSHIYRPGRVGIVSRSGTLNYEAVEQMNARGLGQSTALSIGGDPINGCDFITALRAFERDPDTDAVLLIGEIGGPQEVEAARWAKARMSKPLVAYIAGVSAPPGRRMGHAGAIVSGADDTARAKMERMAELGCHLVENPAAIGATVQRALGGG